MQARLGAYESSGDEAEAKNPDSRRRNDKAVSDKSKSVEVVDDIRANNKESRKDKERDRPEERYRDSDRDKERVGFFFLLLSIKHA